MIDLPFLKRVLMAASMCVLLTFPHGIVQRLNAQSATTRHIPRPDARWTIPQAAPPPAVRQQNFTVRIIRGDNAVNNISTQTAEDPIVEVRDSAGNPLADVSVTFFLPESGPSATFGGGATILGTITDNTGRATGMGLTPNDVQGQFQIEVQASFQDRTVTTNITQRNTLTGTLEGGGGGSSTAIVILGVVGAAAAGLGFALARRSDGGGGGGGTTPPPQPTPTIRITPGDPTVGPPQ